MLHFAGHGESDLDDPSQSSLLLKDWKTNPLTVGDLRDCQLQDNPPFLAYLSACSTGADRGTELQRAVENRADGASHGRRRGAEDGDVGVRVSEHRAGAAQDKRGEDEGPVLVWAIGECEEDGGDDKQAFAGEDYPFRIDDARERASKAHRKREHADRNPVCRTTVSIHDQRKAVAI